MNLKLRVCFWLFMLAWAATIITVFASLSPEPVPVVQKASAHSRLRRPQRHLYAVFSYHDLPGSLAIHTALGRKACWACLGAASELEARAAAEAFPIHFADLSAYRLDGRPAYAITNGDEIRWDVTAGNPYYGLMPLALDEVWQATFHTHAGLTGAEFSSIVFTHELGHRLGGLPQDSGDFPLNRLNTLRVIQNCFPEVLAR